MGLTSQTRQRLFWLSAFAIAMSQLEAAVVVYLRRLFYPGGFQFPLAVLPKGLLAIEVGREASTVVMLAAVAVLSTADRWRRFAAFMLMFAVWDVGYYLWLALMDHWPTSLFTWDILFLIPAPWVGPVLTPLLISALLAAAALGIEQVRDRGKSVRVSRWEWTAAVASGLGLILVFIGADAARAAQRGIPTVFPWPVFLAFLAAGAATAYRAWRRSLRALPD